MKYVIAILSSASLLLLAFWIRQQLGAYSVKLSDPEPEEPTETLQPEVIKTLKKKSLHSKDKS